MVASEARLGFDMAEWKLPLDSEFPHIDVDVEMGGTIYRLTLLWNTRAEFWTLSIGLPDGTPIIQGERLVGDADVFNQVTDGRLPPGRIFTRDVLGRGQAPGRDDLGTDVIMVYDDGQ